MLFRSFRSSGLRSLGSRRQGLKARLGVAEDGLLPSVVHPKPISGIAPHGRFKGSIDIQHDRAAYRDLLSCWSGTLADRRRSRDSDP